MITTEFIQELSLALKPLFVKDKILSINNFEQITGGADTIIYSFQVKFENSEKFELILRIYRPNTSNTVAKSEFKTLNTLHEAKLNVPKPYIIISDENSLNQSCLVMEKIKGRLLADLLFTNDQNSAQLFGKMISSLVDLHKFSWRKHFPEAKIPDIDNDPFILIKNSISNAKELIVKYNIEEFHPLIHWIEKEQYNYACEEVVLLHGDYHPNNIMVQPSGELIILDWSNIRLGDRRQDIAFLILTIEWVAPLRSQIIDLYQNLSGKQLEGIEFFMVTSSLFNLVRIYSMLFNYDITNENDNTKIALLKNFRGFVENFINTIKSVTNLTFPKLEEELKIN